MTQPNPTAVPRAAGIAGVKAAVAERQKSDPPAAPLITATQLRRQLNQSSACA